MTCTVAPSGTGVESIAPVLSGEQILEIQNLVRKVPVADQVILKRESKSNGDWVEIDLVLSWSTRGD